MRGPLRALSVGLLSCVCIVGCSRAPRPAADCTWREAGPSALALSHATHRRHLTDDALRAEDLAIRYADSVAAPHSRHFEGFATYNRTREQCMTVLFGAVARGHAVQPLEVRAALAHRPLAPDVTVLVACAIIYALVAHGVVGRVSHNFPWSGGTDSVAAVAATIGAAVVVSVLAVMVGEWLAISIEIARVGNGHLSYRTGRVPWTHHRTALFAAGTVLFLLVAMRRHLTEDGRSTGR